MVIMENIGSAPTPITTGTFVLPGMVPDDTTWHQIMSCDIDGAAIMTNTHPAHSAPTMRSDGDGGECTGDVLGDCRYLPLGGTNNVKVNMMLEALMCHNPNSGHFYGSGQRVSYQLCSFVEFRPYGN